MAKRIKKFFLSDKSDKSDKNILMDLKAGFSKVTYGDILHKPVFSIQPYYDENFFNSKDKEIYEEIYKKYNMNNGNEENKRLKMNYISNNTHSQISIVLNDNSSDIKNAIDSFKNAINRDVKDAKEALDKAQKAVISETLTADSKAQDVKTKEEALNTAIDTAVSNAITALNKAYEFSDADIISINDIIKKFIEKKNDKEKEDNKYKYKADDAANKFTNETYNKLLIISTKKEPTFIPFMNTYLNNSLQNGGAKKKAKITKKEKDLNKMTKSEIMSKYEYLEGMDKKKKSELIKMILENSKNSKKSKKTKK